VKIGPDLTWNGFFHDGFVAKINAQGTGLEYCGYIGSNDLDKGSAIAVDGQDNAYVAGWTHSAGTDFPVKVGPDLTPNGEKEAFIAKVRLFLSVDTYEISESTGGTVNLALDAGAWNANRNYILLGSVTGTEPGVPLPGGMATLPLNWDVFTDFVASLINTVVFSNFMGTLDGSGTATAQLNAPPVPGFAGVTMHYAYGLNNPWDFVSNPIPVEIVP
jgi:hypothetical protein